MMSWDKLDHLLIERGMLSWNIKKIAWFIKIFNSSNIRLMKKR